MDRLTTGRLARRAGAVEREAEGALTRVEAKIAELERMRRSLTRLVDACRERRPTDECPILDALEPRTDEPEEEDE